MAEPESKSERNPNMNTTTRPTTSPEWATYFASNIVELDENPREDERMTQEVIAAVILDAAVRQGIELGEDTDLDALAAGDADLYDFMVDLGII